MNASRVGFRVPSASVDVVALAFECAARDASAELLRLSPMDRAACLRRIGEAYRRMLGSNLDAEEAEALAHAFVSGLLTEACRRGVV